LSNTSTPTRKVSVASAATAVAVMGPNSCRKWSATVNVENPIASVFFTSWTKSVRVSTQLAWAPNRNGRGRSPPDTLTRVTSLRGRARHGGDV
jgi:hypothetical protein